MGDCLTSDVSPEEKVEEEESTRLESSSFSTSFPGEVSNGVSNKQLTDQTRHKYKVKASRAGIP